MSRISCKSCHGEGRIIAYELEEPMLLIPPPSRPLAKDMAIRSFRKDCEACNGQGYTETPDYDMYAVPDNLPLALYTNMTLRFAGCQELDLEVHIGTAIDRNLETDCLRGVVINGKPAPAELVARNALDYLAYKMGAYLPSGWHVEIRPRERVPA